MRCILAYSPWSSRKNLGVTGGVSYLQSTRGSETRVAFAHSGAPQKAVLWERCRCRENIHAILRNGRLCYKYGAIEGNHTRLSSDVVAIQYKTAKI